MTHELANFVEQLRLLPGYLSHHVVLSLSALTIGIGISLPLGILASKWKRLETVAMGVAGVVQTIPSLALLALMVPLLGMIGWWPALIALVLYSILPVLRNTVTGLQGVDPAVVDAATGMGMTPIQRLIRVELPLAGAAIVGGVRTATVWVVGIATLATPVGQTTLGNFIFAGLQTQNRVAVLVGCVAAAGLALALDGTIRLAEVAARRRRPGLAMMSASVIAVLAVGSLSWLCASRMTTDGVVGQGVTVGAKTFSEQYILAELITQRLEAAGLQTTARTGLGSQVAFDALKSNAIDCYVDYSGTLWTNVLNRTNFPDRETLNRELKHELRSRHNVRVVGSLGFENTYAMAVSRGLSDRLGLRTMSDLAVHAGELSVGGDIEFFARPEWKKACDAYGFRFKSAVSLDSTLMYSAADQGRIDVVAAFSTDGRISSHNLIVLVDDRQAFPPYEAVILVSPRGADNAALIASLSGLVGRIDAEAIRAANGAVDIGKQPPRIAAVRLADALVSGAGFRARSSSGSAGEPTGSGLVETSVDGIER